MRNKKAVRRKIMKIKRIRKIKFNLEHKKLKKYNKMKLLLKKGLKIRNSNPRKNHDQIFER